MKISIKGVVGTYFIAYISMTAVVVFAMLISSVLMNSTAVGSINEMEEAASIYLFLLLIYAIFFSAACYCSALLRPEIISNRRILVVLAVITQVVEVGVVTAQRSYGISGEGTFLTVSALAYLGVPFLYVLVRKLM